MSYKLININENLELLNDYPFQRLNDLLKDVQKPEKSSEIIMSIGEPKHKPPAFVKNIINKNYEKWAKYPPTLGMEKLNIASINWLNRRYNLSKKVLNHKENIVQLAGTREGLFNIALALSPSIKNNNKPVMLLPDPFYQVYAGACRISGAEPVFISSLKKNNFVPSFSSAKKEILKRTSIIYVCSPSNPEGAALKLKEWENLILLARKYAAVLIVDECYTDIYFKKRPLGVLEACKKLKIGLDNIVSFHSLSKRSNVPGIRSGFAVGDKYLIESFKKLRHYCAGQQPLPIQEAATALWNEDSHSEKNRKLYTKKFNLAKEIFKKHKNFYLPDGGFYIWLEVGNGEKFTKLLWKEKGIKVMPGAYLSKLNNSKDYIRIALVSNFKETKTALKGIYDVLRKHIK